MKYNNLHHTKPTSNTPVYFISPEAKEVLGTFMPFVGFNATEGNLKGYMAKWWRYLTDIELQSIQSSFIDLPELRQKRKYIKKSDSYTTSQ